MARKPHPAEGNPPSSPQSAAVGDAGKDESAALWRQITGTVKPLKRRSGTGRPTAPEISVPRPGATGEKKTPPAMKRRGAVRPTPPQSPLVAGAAPGMDKRTAARLRRGQIAIEGRIDLHGMTQQEAHANLSGFIESSAAARRRCVLVITGKSGVLRGVVPKWLDQQPNRSRIISFTPATPRDGGEGALYVLLRRKK